MIRTGYGHDVLVWLPEQSILFAGDLLFNGGTPFALVDDYLAFVQRAARTGINAGVTPLQLAQDLDLGEFAALSDSERIAANLHRVYAELEGHPRDAPLDLQLPIRDMITLNGGQRIRCFA